MKLKCAYWSCDWVGSEADVLTAPDPFDEDGELHACPKCLDQTVIAACTIDGCVKNGDCGGPNPADPGGPFVPLCGEHSRAGRVRP